MTNSRDKGARFERLIAGLFRDAGYNATRSAQHCGKTGDAPDVIGVPYIHIEAKHYANKAFDYKWMEQARRDSNGTDKLPCVIHKIDKHEVLVTMPFDDWMKLYKQYEVNRYLEEAGDE